MAKHIFLARDFFDEDDIFDLLNSPNINKSQRLRLIGAKRGLLLSKESKEDSLISDIARIPFGWSQLTFLGSFLDSEEHSTKESVCRLKNVVGLDQLDKIIADFKKRAEHKIVGSSHLKISPNYAKVTNKYIKRNPLLLKGLQRVELDADIEITPIDGGLEIKFGSDEKSEEIATIFMASIRASSSDETKVEQDEVNFEDKSSESKTKFFTSLIKESPELRFSNATGVKLHKEDKDADSEEIDSDLKKSQERNIAGKIDSASLRGDNLLLTSLFKELEQNEYFIGGITWESFEKTGEERKIIVEAGFSDPHKGKGFFINIRGIYENSETTGTRLIPRDVRKSERIKFVRIISNAAFDIWKQTTLP